MGIENIVAIDGEDKRLSFAMEMGATKTVNFKNYKGVEELAGAVSDAFGGYLADFAFQCTGSPVAHSNIYKLSATAADFATRLLYKRRRRNNQSAL